jgi:hypothetical protein
MPTIEMFDEDLRQKMVTELVAIDINDPSFKAIYFSMKDVHKKPQPWSAGPHLVSP